MSATVLIAVPVLDRPAQAAALVEAIEEGTTVPHRTLFLCSPGDRDEITACSTLADRNSQVEFAVMPWRPGPADYARKVNWAVAAAREPWILMGADDICFCPLWAEAALETASGTGAQVIGTNDMGNPRVLTGTHSTHPLVAVAYCREQGTLDEPGKMLHEGYDHNFCDDELVETAKARKAWAFARHSEVPHQHPNWGRAPWDGTYAKGRKNFAADRTLYQQRLNLILNL